MRNVLGALVLGAGLSGCGPTQQTAPTDAQHSCPSWAQWQDFKTQLLDSSGRVVDRQSEDRRTVSEAQAYAMLFALIANDRESFDTILEWTQLNLAQGDLTAHLPAWLWGRNAVGNWGVLDSNPASDADLWMAYTLIEAGRLWQTPRYLALGELIAARIMREEVSKLPGLGMTLLPAPRGFYDGSSTWRLNPSYGPLQVLQRLALHQPDSNWSDVLASAKRMILETSSGGFAPDWVRYEQTEGFKQDAKTDGAGSYDAIRVYLWAGMLHPQHPGKSTVLESLNGMKQTVLSTGLPPERTHTAGATGTGPVGFSAALLPYLASTGDPQLVNLQLLRLQAKPIPPQAYYQQALSLFGLGWHSGEFRFGPDGELQPRWATGC